MEQSRPIESSQLAEVLQSLATLHQGHQQSLLELRQDQDHRFFEIMRAQAEDRLAIRSLLSQETEPTTATTPDSHATLPPPTLQKMGAADDPEAFLDLFERTAEIWGWPPEQWAARLIPLLSGEAQLAAQQLPATNLLAYTDLKRAILQRVGRSPEKNRQLFRGMKLEKSVRPFAFAQRLRDACRRWLLAGDHDVEGVIDQEVLEQFVQRLPRKTAGWVQCHRPALLEEAVRLAEDHLAAIPRADEPSSSLSPLPLYLPMPSPPPLCFLLLFSPQGPLLPRAGVDGSRDLLPGRGRMRPPIPRLSAALLRWGARQHKCGRNAWAGLLEVRRPGPLPGSVSTDGGGDGGAGLRRPAGCPLSGWSIPDSVSTRRAA
ncbi:uncharacterized protein LOC127625687 [Xyrauchen texanus]|uniref:uncharacterized protein LOC127625687 n=1 Tax=Xyrauchen texanus TaxID=154827 RepID=UPI0022423317|nr:uncharacterized protein LOC127625687 [Xyrauchen texanus]